MAISTIHEAKTNLSRLIEKAERGEEVIIVRGKKPVVRLIPVEVSCEKTDAGPVPGRVRSDLGVLRSASG